MRYVKLVFALTLLTAVLAFVAGNTAPVTLRFLIWETPGVSLSLVAAGFFLLGILFTLVLLLLVRVRRKGSAKPQPDRSSAPAADAPVRPGHDPDATQILRKD